MMAIRNNLSSWFRGFGSALILIFLSGFFSIANAQDEFAIFSLFNDENRQEVPYEQYDAFMEALSVETDGRVNLYYRAMEPQGITFLNTYVDALSQIPVRILSSDEQLAYWLNMRNLLIIRAVATKRIGRSLKISLKRDRGSFKDSGDMWTQKRVTIEGVSLSIDDIERHIILRNWKTPDVLYGLYQGVRGGPPIARRAFRRATIVEDLHQIGDKYINNWNTIRVRKERVTVPKIFDWYRNDLFADDDDLILAHIKEKVQGNRKQDFEAVRMVSYTKMNYSIDEQRVRVQGSPVRNPDEVPEELPSTSASEESGGSGS